MSDGSVQKSRQGGLSRIPMGSLEQSRRTFARVIRAYNRGDIDEDAAKVYARLFSVLLDYWKTEVAQDIERRLDEVEKRVNA